MSYPLLPQLVSNFLFFLFLFFTLHIMAPRSLFGGIVQQVDLLVHSTARLSTAPR